MYKQMNLKEMKIYSVDIYGRANTIYSGLRGRLLHTEIIVARSHKDAKEIAMMNFEEDLSDMWKNLITRRDVKIESEDITFEKRKCAECYYTEYELCR